MRHSLSPAIHNAGFDALDLDWIYVALPVAAGDGARAVEAMDVLGIDGLSVTMPHKADVAAAVSHRTPVVERLGVANCVFRRDGALVADSTDGDGFVRALVDEGIEPDGSRIMVIGTGGAARAIVEALGRSGCAEIVVSSRSRPRAERIAALAPVGRAGATDEATGMDVVVNASPVGMAGGPDPDGVPLNVDYLRPGQAVVDIVYQPRRTPLLVAADERGVTAVNGVGMLLHQAAIAFEHWTGRPAPVPAMRTAAFP